MSDSLRADSSPHRRYSLSCSGSLPNLHTSPAEATAGPDDEEKGAAGLSLCIARSSLQHAHSSGLTGSMHSSPAAAAAAAPSLFPLALQSLEPPRAAPVGPLSPPASCRHASFSATSATPPSSSSLPPLLSACRSGTSVGEDRPANPEGEQQGAGRVRWHASEMTPRPPGSGSGSRPVSCRVSGGLVSNSTAPMHKFAPLLRSSPSAPPCAPSTSAPMPMPGKQRKAVGASPAWSRSWDKTAQH